MTHRRQTAKGAQLAKFVTLAVATAVLCGAVATASMITHRRDTAQPEQRPAAQITGEQALLPDALNGPPPRQAGRSPAPEAKAPEATAPESPAAPAPTTTVPASPPPHLGDTSPSGGGLTVGAATDLELVREFYASLPDSPVSAFAMLAPDVLDTDLDDFLASWSRVDAIDSVEVEQQEEGVLATVWLDLHDGGRLMLRQLLTVAESPRRIVGARLLSAQRG